MSTAPACHLEFIFNRGKTHGVILRRGPSKQVLAIRWDMTTDNFTAGQWLNGRIYAERCSLSPNGEYFAYFAANHRSGSLGSWTAVSRPPFLTAIGLWSCGGGTWFQGGEFVDDQTFVIWLPYKGPVPKIQPGLELPPRFRVLGPDEFYAEYPDFGLHRFTAAKHGFYDSINLIRHGWELLPDSASFDSRGLPVAVTWAKGTGLVDFGRPFIVIDAAYRVLCRVPRAIDWCDFSRDGDLLYAIGGRVYRLENRAARQFETLDLTAQKPIADFTPLTFSELEAPDWAKTWDRHGRPGQR